MQRMGGSVGSAKNPSKIEAFSVNLADGEGFEPPVSVNPRRFSRPVQSTTLPPIPLGIYKHLAFRDLEQNQKLVPDWHRKVPITVRRRHG